MSGKFYSVGVGPGDPELVTLKAIKTIENSDLIVVPDSGAKNNVALEIAGKWIKDKKILALSMPMTRDRSALDGYHEEAADNIAVFLDMGKQVSFLTLGDPSIYSTAMYVHRKLQERHYSVEIIPGVPSFCAAAAALNFSLCEGSETLHVVPASYQDVAKTLDWDGTKVFMKSGKSMKKVKELLQQRNSCAAAVERCGMPGESIHKNLESMDPTPSYFSIVIVKGKPE